MRPIAFSLTLATADSDGIAQSQAPAGGGVQNLTLDGALVSSGVALLDVARRVQIASSGNDSPNTFIIYGTDRFGNSISESLTGPNAGSVTSLYDYLTVNAITISDDSVGNITAGTNGQASTDWIPLDRNNLDFLASVFVELSVGATLNWTVQYTPADIRSSFANRNVPSSRIYPANVSNMVTQSTSQNAVIDAPVEGIRLTLNSFTSGTATLTAIQQG